MRGTITDVSSIYISGNWYRVTIYVMQHPENGIPVDDIRAVFYVKGEDDIPLVDDDVTLFKYDGETLVAYESWWYENIPINI